MKNSRYFYLKLFLFRLWNFQYILICVMVKFLYQGRNVFDIFVPLLTEITEFLWDINWQCSVKSTVLRDFICMWYKEAKPSNTFSKQSSENDQRHFRYRLFKFPIFFYSKGDNLRREAIQIQLDVICTGFRINNVVVLLTYICASHLWKVKWHLFYSKRDMIGKAVFNKGLITP